MLRVSVMAVPQWTSGVSSRVNPLLGSIQNRRIPMKHYIVKYVSKRGRAHKITVLARSINDALTLFNDSRKLLNVKEIISIEPEKIFENL